jgi:tetraacyldisaccharide 4'-kinase
LPGFVVSVGNLTVGGTGKTPMACMLAKWALGEGYRVAILSRGYGGHYREKVLAVSDGERITVGPSQSGDEPYLLAKKLRDVPVVISKKRYEAGLFANKKFDTNFFIMDDGFQHLALKRDMDLVLIDASSPFGNRHLLPWGTLREPIAQLKRADAFIITRSGQGSQNNELCGLLTERHPAKPLFQGDHIPERIVFPSQNRVYEPEFLRGKRIMAFAGIARPEAFKDTLNGLGAEVIYFESFRDHHSFKKKEIRELFARKERMNADYLITTEKDWVRLEYLETKHQDLAFMEIRFDLIAQQDAFFSMIKDRMERDV